MEKPVVQVRQNKAKSTLQTLAEFLGAARQYPMSNTQRRLLVDEAIVLLENFYVHLSFKRAMHGVDPLRRLKRLKQSGLDELADDDDLPFHREMVEIFDSTRDLHTNYLLPAPYGSCVAFLLFQVEEYWDGKEHRYIVTRRVTSLDNIALNKVVDRTFKADLVGVAAAAKAFFDANPKLDSECEIILWNGVPIRDAINLMARRCPGGTAAARRAQAVSRLTTRPMIRATPPEELAVTLTYAEPNDGGEHTVTAPWLVFEPPRRPSEGWPIDARPARTLDVVSAGVPTPSGIAWARGDDAENEMARRVRLALLVPGKMRVGKMRVRPGTVSVPPKLAQSNIFDHDCIKDKKYGYIRIRTFDVANPERMVEDFARLLQSLPRDGLVIDVRDNGGGIINIAERLLQMLTPETIQPAGFQFAATDQTRRLPGISGDYDPWKESLRRSGLTSDDFSGACPISSALACNRIGQLYDGPVVLIANPLSYSATDMFVAGFKDHGIGKIIMVDGRTGAGGASVTTNGELRGFFPNGQNSSPFPGFLEWPLGAGFRVALLRSIRVRDGAGSELEDFGVKPDKEHKITRNDLLQKNADLKATAAAMLDKMFVERSTLEVSISDSVSGIGIDLSFRGRNIRTVEVRADREPAGMATFSIPGAGQQIVMGSLSVAKPGIRRVELTAFNGDDRVVGRRLLLKSAGTAAFLPRVGGPVADQPVCPRVD